MKQAPKPIPTGPLDVEPDRPHRAHHRRRAGREPGGGRCPQMPQLKMTSMIDVVFLLLIFFVVTASFTIEEGTLQAQLPGNSDPGPDPIEIPTLVDLRSSDDGVTYSLQVNGVQVDGASGLWAHMANRVRTGQMASDDLVKIQPQGVVRWQHVLNVYNACVSAELTRVTFAP